LWKTCLKYNPKHKQAKRNLKEFTNEYGLPRSSVGSVMDDVQAFIHIKMEEISDSNPTDQDIIMKKIMNTWNNKIASRYALKLDKMNAGEKIRLFKETKVL